MDLHHENVVYLPAIKNPEAISPSDPDLVPTQVKEMLKLLNDLDNRLRPYRAHKNIRDITEEAYDRMMAEILRALVDALEMLAQKWDIRESLKRSLVQR
jgi:hypothetical protein